MISLSKLSQITKLNEKPLHFTEDNQFTQKSSLQITIDKLEKEYEEKNDNKKHSQTTENFMMSQEITNNNETENNNSFNNTDFQNNQNTENYNNGVLLYGENEIINMPDFIETMFEEGISLTVKNSSNSKSSSNLSINSWYVYGVKNPDSFYKCHVLLNYPDYILKSNREKNSLVSTYKNEMAVQLDSTFKKLLYRKFGFNRDNMIQTLLNSNQINYSIMIYLSDYNKCNICMIDLNKQSYQIFETVLSKSDFYYIIIKDGNTYIPVMNNSGNHLVSKLYLNYMTDRFEKEEIMSPYKERLFSLYKNFKQEFNNNRQELINKIKQNPIIKEDLQEKDELQKDQDLQKEQAFQEENNNDGNISLQIQINNKKSNKNSNNTKLIVKKNNKNKSNSKTEKNTESNKPNKTNKTNNKTNNETNNEINNKKNNKIKSIKEYTLPQLQDLAKEFGIEIYKMGKREHMIKKLKAELYKELNSAMNS